MVQSGEWRTLMAIALVYPVWGALSVAIPLLPVPLGLAALVVAVFTVTFHASLQHETIHGHPTRNRHVNEALVALPLGLFFPYRRFRTLHLRHHRDETLTDPYDDPESWYLAEAGWARIPPLLRPVFHANTTLAGRFVFGPALALTAFYRSEIGHLRRAAPGVRKAWALHGLGLVPVVLWLTWVAGWPVLLYAALIAYPAMGLLMIRTFAEHRAHETALGRTVIIEHEGLLSLLFLNNNLHLVHHQNPQAPWYDLPRLYGRDATRYRQANGGYVFQSYGALARRFLLKAKEPVTHPLWRKK